MWGIALINAIVKIFTFILNFHISLFCESFHILPESQSGFRKKQGCIDNIFILNAVTQIQLSKPKQKLFVPFVDFSKAFDSVVFDILWKKLYSVGISSKMIRILWALYSNAHTCIKTCTGCTPPVEITRGVLQGDVLSPLLFTLLLADLDDFLRDNNCKGISNNHYSQINVLAYADDLTLLAGCRSDMWKTIKCLEKYCENIHLKINIAKTKMLITQKNGSSRDKSKFYLNVVS